MVVSQITVLPRTELPCSAIKVGFHKESDFGRLISPECLKESFVVFYVSFMLESPKKGKGEIYDISTSLGYFPKQLLLEGSLIVPLATSEKFPAKLGDKVDTTQKWVEGSFVVECVLGCGKRSLFTAAKAYTLSATVSDVISRYGVSTAVFMMPELEIDHVKSLITGTLVNLAADNRFKKDDSHDYRLKKLVIFSPQYDKMGSVAEESKVLSSAVHTARELCTAPANYANTISISQYVERKLTSLGLAVKILEEEECRKLGMGAYLGVAQGSMYPPKFLHAIYKAPDPIKKKIALVGKGIMFDSGGYNIKSALSHLHLMKNDMGGMAAVFGTAEAIAALKPASVEVHFISALCENMLDASSYRPGDIITASNGKTIEVINTDAEGRLTLADALVYAGRLDVDLIIDVATLTYSCFISLGCSYASYFANDEELALKFSLALKKSGEQAWRLPLADDYSKAIKSKVADLSNCSYTVKCSSIVAALFLREFVEKSKWLHLDIASVAFDDSSCRATGYGVRTLTTLILDALL